MPDPGSIGRHYPYSRASRGTCTYTLFPHFQMRCLFYRYQICRRVTVLLLKGLLDYRCTPNAQHRVCVCVCFVGDRHVDISRKMKTYRDFFLHGSSPSSRNVANQILLKLTQRFFRSSTIINIAMLSALKLSKQARPSRNINCRVPSAVRYISSWPCSFLH